MRIKKGSWPVLPLFDLLRELGNVSDSEMYRTFNMALTDGQPMLISDARFASQRKAAPSTPSSEPPLKAKVLE